MYLLVEWINKKFDFISKKLIEIVIIWELILRELMTYYEVREIDIWWLYIYIYV